MIAVEYDHHPWSPAAVLFLVGFLGLLALGVGYMFWWVAGSYQAVFWLKKYRRRMATLPATPRPIPGISVQVRDDISTADLMRSATTMYAGLMADGREFGQRQRIKVVTTGEGLQVVKPAVFDAPDVPFDEVGLFDRSNKDGARDAPMARFSRFLVADEWDDGTVHIGEPDPW
jgi:hypothetical protein